MTVDSVPVVTTNPSSQTVTAGSSVTLTAAASGEPAATVQWKSNTGSGTTFSAISGATSTSYTFTPTTADSGDQYEAVFTNSLGTATSTAATLTVNASATGIISGDVDLANGSGFAGISVELTSSGSTTHWAQSLSDGSYSFTGLAAGTYTVQVVPPSELAVGTTESTVTLTAGQDSTGNDFTIQGAQTDVISLRMFLASTGTLSQFLTGLHNAPSVQASGSSSTTTGGNIGPAIAYTTGNAGTSIASGVTIASPDSPTLASMTATIENLADGSSETLSADTAGTTLTSDYANGVLTVSGVASVATYKTVLDSLEYSDTATPGTGGSRTVSIVVNDGTDTSPVATVTVTVTESTSSAPTVTTNPTTAMANLGGTVTFTAAASGIPTPTVQWEVNTGSGYTDVSDTGVYSGAPPIAHDHRRHGDDERLSVRGRLYQQRQLGDHHGGHADGRFRHHPASEPNRQRRHERDLHGGHLQSQRQGHGAMGGEQ